MTNIGNIYHIFELSLELISNIEPIYIISMLIQSIYAYLGYLQVWQHKS